MKVIPSGVGRGVGVGVEGYDDLTTFVLFFTPHKLLCQI